MLRVLAFSFNSIKLFVIIPQSGIDYLIRLAWLRVHRFCSTKVNKKRKYDSFRNI